MSTRIYPSHLMTPSEVAHALGVTESTLAVWRCTSRYPLQWVKIGRKVFYREEDISKFINSNLRQFIHLDPSKEGDRDV